MKKITLSPAALIPDLKDASGLVTASRPAIPRTSSRFQSPRISHVLSGNTFALAGRLKGFATSLSARRVAVAWVPLRKMFRASFCV